MMGDECNAPEEPARTLGSPLGERLLSASFPHPTGQMELLETHISWVVLTGEWAYKIKKPVQYPFLDYSTIPLRERFCHREVQVNRLWAESLYQDVVPIFGAGERLRFGVAQEQPAKDESLVDHAVRMTQFPQTALLIEQLKAGNVTPEMAETLGGFLADLHERIEPVRYQEDLIRGGAIDPAMENFDYLLGVIAANDPDRERIEHLKCWTDQSIDQLLPLMERRARGGSVRKCHGDLHLGNILFLDGRFILFDGVEFNDAFSQIERLNEMAFLAMELSEHGFVSHSRRLINQYLESTGDYDGLALLRYFLVYRAMVRAKVDLIRQAQKGPSDNNEGEFFPRFSNEGRCYLDYAKNVTSPPVPELWITYGLSGSGKSTMSSRVVESKGFLRVRSDVQRKLIACHDPYAKTPRHELANLYSTEMTLLTYERLWNLVDRILQVGFGVIVDAAFLKLDQRKPFQELAKQHGVPFKILVCEASTDELKQRLKTRGPDPSDADESVLEEQLLVAQPPVVDELSHVIKPASIMAQH